MSKVLLVSCLVRLDQRLPVAIKKTSPSTATVTDAKDMKEACASASSPALPSPRPAPAPAPRSPRDAAAAAQNRAEGSTSDTRLSKRARSAHDGRRAACAGGAGGEQRARIRKKSPSTRSPKREWRMWEGDATRELRRGARALRDARDRLRALHEKAAAGAWGEREAREAAARAAQLLSEAERLQRCAAALPPSAPASPPLAHAPAGHTPGDTYEPALSHEMRMAHPSVLLAPPHAVPGPGPLGPGLVGPNATGPGLVGPGAVGPGGLRSKSELELSRRLSESLDMQERLAADNAALDGKRYILYKELMCKEQRLETARAQAARLRAELKLLASDNARLAQAAASAHASSCSGAPSAEQRSECGDREAGGEPSPSHSDLEKQVCALEEEVCALRAAMADSKGAKIEACRGGGAKNTCFNQPMGMPPMPPMQRVCGVCPPCPAQCNPEAAPTPAEREAARLGIQLKQTEESYKAKVTECATLRAEVLRRKEEAERQRCLAREAQARLRELEMKFEGLTTHTNMTLGTKEQAIETEISVRTLKQCYREAREEVDELRALLTEQGVQLQDYRVKYLQSQQLAEEQKRQLAALDMDNQRISEQINLEIQRVKIKFQEKLQELAPIPSLLQATQRRLQDAQQSQALAEHTAEQLARELNCAREKVHVLLHNSLKPPAEKGDRSSDEKLLQTAQARVTQLLESNAALKSEIERLKMNVIRMEEAVLSRDQRLQEKLQECAALGAELDRARDEASRAVLRANQRADTVRTCMQTTVAELERQLANSRAQVVTAEKAREELQARMSQQIQRLQENFEQAQLRVLGLQSQVLTLRRRASSTDAGDGDNADEKICACKTFFND